MIKIRLRAFDGRCPWELSDDKHRLVHRVAYNLGTSSMTSVDQDQAQVRLKGACSCSLGIQSGAHRRYRDSKYWHSGIQAIRAGKLSAAVSPSVTL